MIGPAKVWKGTRHTRKVYGRNFSLLPLKQATSLRLLCMKAAIDLGLHSRPKKKFFTLAVNVCTHVQVNAQKALKLLAASKILLNPPQESLIQAPRGLNHV